MTNLDSFFIPLPHKLIPKILTILFYVGCFTLGTIIERETVHRWLFP